VTAEQVLVEAEVMKSARGAMKSGIDEEDVADVDDR